MLGACSAQVLRSATGPRLAHRSRSDRTHWRTVCDRKRDPRPAHRRPASQIRQARRRTAADGHARIGWRARSPNSPESPIRRRRSAMRSRAACAYALLPTTAAEIDNNAAGTGLARRRVGTEELPVLRLRRGGERAAAIYSLIGTAKLNGTRSRRSYLQRRPHPHRRSPGQPHRRTAALERIARQSHTNHS